MFGGETGWLRLLDQSMGGQAGWFLGFALVCGCRARREPPAPRRRPHGLADRRRRRVPDPGRVLLRAGDLPPLLFSSLLAPFTAALVGAGAAQLAEGGTIARVLGPLAVLAGVAAEVAILRDNPDSLAGCRRADRRRRPAAAALAFLPQRAIALGAAIGVLLIAPAAWSAQTLGHATSGTFPAGGPQTAGMGGGPAGRGAAAARRAAPRLRAAGGGPPAAAQGGGMFGGDSAALTEALAYARPRRRHDRRLLPVGRRHAGHRRRGGRGDRRLLRQRVRGDRALARRRRARRARSAGC